MSKMIITIETDNASFADSDEVGRILTGVAAKANNGEVLDGLRLYDINGNTVGKVEVIA